MNLYIIIKNYIKIINQDFKEYLVKKQQSVNHSCCYKVLKNLSSQISLQKSVPDCKPIKEACNPIRGFWKDYKGRKTIMFQKRSDGNRKRPHEDNRLAPHYGNAVNKISKRLIGLWSYNIKGTCKLHISSQIDNIHLMYCKDVWKVVN